MLYAVIFLLSFVAIGLFARWLSRNVEHGEVRFHQDEKGEDAE